METPRKTVIVGGAGFIGQAIAAELVSRAGGAAGAVRILTRSRSRARALWSLPGIEIVTLDPREEGALGDALAGASQVVNLVGLLHSKPGRPWGPDFDEAHVKLPSRLARCMTRQGVRRLIHISALGVSDHAPSMYLRSKAAGEAALRGVHGLDLTILRPSVVFGPGDQFLRLFARLQAIMPIVPLATPHAKFQPVYVGDLAHAVCNAIENPKTIGQVYDVGGPDVLSLYEIVHWAGVYSGHPRPILPLPDSLSWLQALVMEHLPGRPLISRDNLASASVPNVSAEPMSAALGIRAPMSLHAMAPLFLGGQTVRGRLLQRRTTRLLQD